MRTVRGENTLRRLMSSRAPQPPGRPPEVDPPAAGGVPDIAEQRLARPAAVMAAGTAFSRVTGLGRVIALAAALGVAESRLADAYNLANTLPIVLYELALGGVLSSVFIPVLVEELRSRSREEAWRAVSAMVTCAIAVLLALTLVAVLAAPLVIDVFSGRVEGRAGEEQRELATFFLRIFAPQIALFGVAAIGQGLLNAHGKFALPAFAPILNNVVIIATFIAFALIASGVPTSASVQASATEKWLLALGSTGGVAAMAAAYWPSIRRLPGRIRARFEFRHPAVRRLARLSVWALVYAVTNALGVVVSFYLANQVQGGITAYVIAFTFFQLPIGIAAVSVTTALTPKLAAHHVDGDVQEFRRSYATGMRLLGLLMLPSTAAYLVLADPITQILLEHGIAKGRSAEFVASVLRYFALGTLPFAAFQLLRAAFYARQDARTPAAVNVLENVVTVGLDLALFPLMKVQGLALAHSLGYVVGVAVLMVPLARRIGGLYGRDTLAELAKVTAGCAAMAGVMLLVLAGVRAAMEPGDLRALVELAAGGLAGAGVFVGAAWALRVRDLAFFLELLPGRRGAAAAPAAG
jgi:putative peptidoglycan lipid II flippase